MKERITPRKSPLTFQQLFLALHQFWSQQGCLILQSYDTEMGAGTFHPATFLRVLGKNPWRAAYVQACRRPADGRYGENPNRLQHYYQYQVVIKPPPSDIQRCYLDSLAFVGICLSDHDIRFVQDDWESPTLGAWGLGWEVRLDGMEMTQFTYFQEVGGIRLEPVCVELTYGLERIAMYLQGVDNVFDLVWTEGISYREMHHETEVQFSTYHFNRADVEGLRTHFLFCEKEAQGLLAQGLILPAYDYCIKSSHLFNMLDARGVFSLTERAGFVARVRRLARQIAKDALSDPADTAHVP